jgi:hypothetical protein
VRHLTRTAALITATALAAFGLVSQPAGAATQYQHDIRAANLTDATTGASGEGNFQFLHEGIHINSASDEETSVEFAVNKPLSSVHDFHIPWIGAPGSGSPSQYYGINMDSDPAIDGYLIAETVYGSQDVWLTSGSPEMEAKAPVVGGGSGSEYHGTLDQWAAKLPGATIKTGGFLAAGADIDGVLKSLTYGADTYTFTNAARQAVTGTAKITRIKRAVRVDFIANRLIGDNLEGTPVTFQVKVTNTKHHRSITIRAFTARLHAGETARWHRGFHKGTGTYKIAILRNGVQIHTVTVRTGS